MIASFRCPGSPRPAASDRPGYALLAVLIVVAVLSLVAYQFTDAMTSEYVAASRTTDVVQSRLNAISGISYAAALLTDAGSTGINPYEDASLANVPVAASENPRKDARFALVAVGGDATSGFTVRNGVTDEGGKINLNALIQLDSTGQLLHDALMALPNMTEDIADAIVDWVDPDDTERPAGAESGYYLGLEQPYRAKNGPMNTLDELLLVRGVTWQLLYGNDRNRNGIADDTPGGSQTLDRGWAEYLTVYGRELNSTSSGEPRLYLGTSDDLVTFHSNLVTAIGQEMADYILAYKLFDVSQVPTSSAGPSASSSSQSVRGVGPVHGRAIGSGAIASKQTTTPLDFIPGGDTGDVAEPHECRFREFKFRFEWLQ
ncbi:MAG: general secretion pathway protein GspK [Bacteroidales bacterium]|nr:general secretion pathway protein GspK [Bacteroidales bacterium]